MNKLPLSSLPEIGYNKDGDTLFELLLNQSCNMQLSFQDALYALFKIKGQERRTQILNWMIEAYNDSYAINIKEYRSCEDALWKNTKNEDIHITKLYALEYGNKMLEQYFGTLQQVINKEYFPAGSISFRKA